MKELKVVLFIFLSTFSVFPAYSQIKYPVTRTCDRVDTYFGEKVADPYQWLECDTCPEVEAWVKEENKITNTWLEAVPFRKKIRDRLTRIWSFPYKSEPVKKGDIFYYFANNGTQNHNVLYYYTSKDTTAKVLIDPNTFPGHGTMSLNDVSFSKSGRYVAYSISKMGSDWNEIMIKEVKSGRMLRDHIKWVKFSGIAWKGDGFFYSRYDAPKGAEYSSKNEFHKVAYHKIGDDPAKDKVVFEDKLNPLRNFYITVSDDQTVAILNGSEGTSGNSLMVADITAWKPGAPIKFIAIETSFDHDHSFIEKEGEYIYLHSNENAPAGKLVRFKMNSPEKKHWETIVPEKKSVLESVTFANGKMILKYLENVSSKLYICDVDGKNSKEIELPVIGTVNSVHGEKGSNEVYFSMVSYTFPTRIYKLDLSTLKSEVYFRPRIEFNSDDYSTKQVWYTSKDGTKIPMFITHKKNLVIDGNSPLFLFGYGGFNISYKPEFRVDRTVFLENGGIYCVANIRGGGEFGEDWHKAGTKLQKQNVFDDFIAAAEYLIKEKYTNKDKIAIHGRSNGGLLAGACLTQRPDLFKCVIPQVGVLDMLKFHQFTIGWAWKGDYGSSENEEQYHYLKKYSPVHNVKKQNYPATMVITGDHDDRVVPAHSFKFIAELQSKQQGNEPVLIRIDAGGGHGSGKPLSMQIAEYSDMWTFVFANLGMTIN